MLRFTDVTYSYPFSDKQAVEQISLHAEAGQALLCTGSSGCGKSTLIRLANGLAPHYFQGDLKGQVVVAGTDNADRPIHAIGHDLGTLFQDPEQQFFALNVTDELAFAHEWRNTPPNLIKERIMAAAQQFGLLELLESSIHELSEGQKQKIALAGIMSLGPKLLILDEPSANLDPEATRELALMLADLKKSGVTLLIVDHRLYWLRDLIDQVLVMENGRIVKQIPFAELDDDALRERYGLRNTSVHDRRGQLACVTSHSGAISISGLTFAYQGKAPLFTDFSVALPKGMVIGIIGTNGVGKTTFARLITGLLPMKCGNISIDGKPVTPKELMHRSSIVLQNTDHQLHMHTVRKELEAVTHHHADRADTVAVAAIMQEFNIAHLADRHPQSLSGGEKQRLVIACAVIRQPDILILDEPTSGLDGANMAVIAETITRFARRGACVLVISHDLELLERVCTCRMELCSTGLKTDNTKELNHEQPNN